MKPNVTKNMKFTKKNMKFYNSNKLSLKKL